jgi:hypothetical protein
VAHEEEAEAPKINYPKSENHINCEIRDFLDHFNSSRRIVLEVKRN